MSRYIKAAAAELAGTFVIVFAGCGAIMADVLTGGTLGQLGVGAVFGLAVAVMILVFGPVSGAHFNPVISLVMMAVRGFAVRRTVVYMIAQVVGGILAAWVLGSLLGTIATIGLPRPNREIAEVIGMPASVLIFSLECVFGAVLVTVVLATAKRARLEGPRAAASVGATVALATFAIGALTGAALNPARYFGPAVVADVYLNAQYYLLAAVVGGFGGALFYRLVIDAPERPSPSR